MTFLSLGIFAPAEAQTEQDAAAIERELAITAYNYAAGCAERQNYEEALEGLSHIPVNRLTQQQQGWADTLRMKCEAMVGHPMAGTEIQLLASEEMSLDDQSEAFMSGIRNYQAGQYLAALNFFTEVIDMGDGPRKQVLTEAMFWRGQTRYMLGDWDGCCNDLILFNDTKNAETDKRCDIMAYYTMGYARMQAKKWHQARLNFERYLDRETQKTTETCSDGKSRYKECKELESKGGKANYRLPLEPAKVEPLTGMTVELTNSLNKVYSQANKERQQQEAIKASLKDWQAPYIEE